MKPKTKWKPLMFFFLTSAFIGFSMFMVQKSDLASFIKILLLFAGYALLIHSAYRLHIKTNDDSKE